MLDELALIGAAVDEQARQRIARWTDARAVALAADDGLEPNEPPPGGRSGRRREERFDAVSTLLWMQWWRDGECLGRSARLVNVSRQGAMIVAPVLLREEQALRLFLEEVDDPVGVGAVVLGAIEGRTGRHVLRLAFPSGCPETFMTAAINGFESWLGAEPRARTIS
jgi:hypothetical protein